MHRIVKLLLLITKDVFEVDLRKSELEKINCKIILLNAWK